MASMIANILTGGALEAIPKIIDSIRGKSPEDAAKLQELLTKHQGLVIQTGADIEKAKIQANVDLNATAGNNIQAEAKANWYTACARPTIIYCWVVLMLYNFAFAPLRHMAPAAFPTEFWTLCEIVITGYVTVRGAQEIAGKVVGGQGGTIQLPFGIKAESKGD